MTQETSYWVEMQSLIWLQMMKIWARVYHGSKYWTPMTWAKILQLAPKLL